MEDPYAQVIKRTWIPQMHRRSLPASDYFSEYNTPNDFRAGRESRDDLEFLPPENDELTVNDLRQMYPLIRYLNQMKLNPEEIQNTLTPEEYDKLVRLLAQIEATDPNEEEEIEADPFERFTLEYNTPDNFRAGWESRDALGYNDEIPESRIYFDENDEPNEEYGSGYNTIPAGAFRELKNTFEDNNFHTKEIFRELQQKHNSQSNPGVYTEGGVVYAPRSEEDQDLDQLLTKYNLGFKRPERLDVKKPGPPFDAQILDGKRAVPNKHQNFHSAFTPTRKDLESNEVVAQEPYIVDTDYVYVEFENE